MWRKVVCPLATARNQRSHPHVIYDSMNTRDKWHFIAEEKNVVKVGDMIRHAVLMAICADMLASFVCGTGFTESVPIRLTSFANRQLPKSLPPWQDEGDHKLQTCEDIVAQSATRARAEALENMRRKIRETRRNDE